MITDNLILKTDSYKPTHWPQYEPGTSEVSSFFESRGGKWPATIFAGLQPIVREHLCHPITMMDVQEAEDYISEHISPTVFNRKGWERIVKEHKGFLPVRIRAVQEGSLVPTSNVLMTVENTDPELPWVTNYIESLLVQVWYPCTVATQSFYMKQSILKALEESGSPESIMYKLHDFGFRGSTSVESAAIGGMAHLFNFAGTDTLVALVMARVHYFARMAGHSIPAAEHSTITSWGRAREGDACENMLVQYPRGPVAVVSDSYDIFKCCEDIWGGRLHDQVVERDGVLIIRPDSGEPVSVILAILRILGDKFGVEMNDKGFKLLHPKVRLIQGDGIDPETMVRIMKAMIDAKWSIDNIAFGSGGALLQKVNRDDSKYAFKCSSVVVNGERRSVMKDPITDPGKRSKAGRLALQGGPNWATLPEHQVEHNALHLIYDTGKVHTTWTLAAVRARIDETAGWLQAS